MSSNFGKTVSPMFFNGNGNSGEGKGNAQKQKQQQQQQPNTDAKMTFCHNWLLDGRCPRSDEECLYAHGIRDLNMSQLAIPSKAKTAPCKNFGTIAGCPFGLQCKYAHGQGELRQHQQQQQAISNQFLNASMPGFSQNVAPQFHQNESAGNENMMKMMAEMREEIRTLRMQSSGAGMNLGNGQNGGNGQQQQGKGQQSEKKG